MAVRIARTDELSPGQSKKFLLRGGGREIEGFLLNVGGAFHAYVNRCRHVPMGLAWVGTQFCTEDGQCVQRATHGAYYVPDTGECIAGPPCGKSLTRVPLRIEGGEIFADDPGPLPED